MLFFVGVRVDAGLGVLMLPAVIDSLERFVVVVATAFLTMPTLVKASPFNLTTDPDPTIEVEVEAWRSTKLLFSFGPFVDVKQNSSEFRGVVAHPLGQHTLLIPLTEKVV